MKRIIRFLLPAISIIVFSWIYKGEGDSWLHSFFYGCFVTFALLLPSYIKLGIKGYVCYGLVLLGTLTLFLSLVKGVPVANALDIRLCLLYWALLFNTSCRTSFGLVLAM